MKKSKVTKETHTNKYIVLVKMGNDGCMTVSLLAKSVEDAKRKAVESVEKQWRCKCKVTKVTRVRHRTD